MTLQQPHSNPAREAAVRVVEVLREAGHVAYFAGGCVRDALMGLQPKDYDVATDAPPDKVRSLFPRTQAVGQAFGVILVRMQKQMIEVATFRTDGVYTDGRRPDEVTFTTAENDARRRDFTINGLFYDPIGDRIIDYVGGQADLTAKVLRAIGNPAERFTEDHLRSLRAVRFASRFGLTIEAQTLAALRDSIRNLPRISPERVADELRKMLTPPWRKLAFSTLADIGALTEIFRVASNRFTWRTHPGESVFLSLPTETSIPFGLALIALLADQRAVPTGTLPPIFFTAERERCIEVVRQLLKLSNQEADEMLHIGRDVHDLVSAGPPTVAALKRFLARPHSAAARMLLTALRAAGFSVDTISLLERRLSELAQMEFAPPPLLTGAHLLLQGHRPGPAFKRVLDAVYDAQLEDRVKDEKGALLLAEELLANA